MRFTSANQPGAVNCGTALPFHIEHPWPALTDPERSASATHIAKLIAVVVSVLCLSCAKRELPGVPFERSVTWRASERLAVEQRQQPFRIGDGPTYRAVWTNGGVCLHYCLMGNGIFSMSGPWPLVVFSDDGRILEENEVIAGVDLEPRRLLSVSPLQVGFGYRGRLGPGLAETNGAHYSPQEWQSATQRVYTGYVEARRKWEAEERANQMPTQ